MHQRCQEEEQKDKEIREDREQQLVPWQRCVGSREVMFDVMCVQDFLAVCMVLLAIIVIFALAQSFLRHFSCSCLKNLMLGLGCQEDELEKKSEELTELTNQLQDCVIFACLVLDLCNGRE